MHLKKLRKLAAAVRPHRHRSNFYIYIFIIFLFVWLTCPNLGADITESDKATGGVQILIGKQLMVELMAELDRIRQQLWAEKKYNTGGIEEKERDTYQINISEQRLDKKCFDFMALYMQ